MSRESKPLVSTRFVDVLFPPMSSALIPEYMGELFEKIGELQLDGSEADRLLENPAALEQIQIPKGSAILQKRLGDEEKKSKAKRKRKVRPAKVMDGKPDPERWVRLKDRSYFKKNYKKRKSSSKR
eukprot:NODE_5433_length_677_cov_14.382166_g5058_i0.p1 GENE.NODE_5433_length_677_cov_14.382166_g5058_i0~~NODE_5433_length_677_cov_14.382166_g5058_i0.p1  ORF type:complete len:126 (+),score=21.17 NODE_5433_length_677_cov_14.382166_g5058_i0:187-564(+)